MQSQCGVLRPACGAASLSSSRTTTCARGAIALHPARSLQRSSRRLMAVRAEEQRQPAAAAADEPEIAAEQLLKRRKGGGGGGGKQQKGPTVVAPVRDQVYGGGPLTAEQKAENSVVALLATLFFVILIEGILVAGSGFMSEGLDQFVQDVVLPAFSPTVILFLSISTLYGLWKTRSAPKEGQ